MVLILLLLCTGVAWGQQGSRCIYEQNYCVDYLQSAFDSVRLDAEAPELHFTSKRYAIQAVVYQLPEAIDYNFKDLYQREVNQLAQGASVFREYSSDINPDFFRVWMRVEDQWYYLQYQRIRNRVIALRMQGSVRVRAAVFKKIALGFHLYENAP